MKRKIISKKMLSLLAFAAFTAVGLKANAQNVTSYPPLNGGKSVSIPPNQFKFTDTKIRGVDGKAKIESVDVYNDPNTGQHITFSKFSPGFKSKLHSHSHDYYAVVIKGEMENYETGVKPVKLLPGSYFYQKARKAHMTECVSKEGCLIFVAQSTQMDVNIPPLEK
ncbi:cupin domain-containing protein [Mucilaginibacter sp. SG564]|uniref:cupin domain-containing protein n=1 Tax=Mucilaginibacter sp. SG564 TaxID=2587022 RepID=UPI00155295BF|nr:DUF4437 domain-containing protein [Mucilaginibacter sp. SG564]NOW96025.1 quercetin dioxygenase-like cupin family protein [Mucilaginibacter sp. SG564]